MPADGELEKDTQETTTEEVVKTTEETSQEEETEDGQPEYTEHEKKMFERAKKAEAEAKRLKAELETAKKKPQTQEPKDDGLTPKDLYALMEAKVPQVDVDEVVKASKLLGKSIPETLKDNFVQARLKDLAEQRQTANATNTSGSKRTTAKLTDEGLVEKAHRGGDVDPEALAIARINLKKAKK